MSISTPLEQFVFPSTSPPTTVIISQSSNASWPTVGPDVRPPLRPHALHVAPILNKVYFSKKTLQQTLKRYDASMQKNEICNIWEIPFSVDVNEPVTELTQKIQKVMTDQKIYYHWDINFSNFTILAKQITYE